MRLQGPFYTASTRVLLPAMKSADNAAVRNLDYLLPVCPLQYEV